MPIDNDFIYGSSMFIGETTRGVKMPVFWDANTPMYNNRPPCSIVTGAPGSGKTFFGLTVTTLSWVLGKTTVVLDPKGDFIPLTNLQKELGSCNLWNLTDSNGGRAGILDPFNLGDTPEDKLNLSVSVIDLFVGGLSDTQMTVLAPILKDIIDLPNPSLQKVVLELRGSQRQEARDLGTKLDLIQNMKYSKLCFAPGNSSRGLINFKTGVTIVTLPGMPLPKTEEEAKSNSGRLVSGILFLLTDFIRKVMENMDSKQPKMLIIDEAWNILMNKYGAGVVQSVALLGRSKNIGLMLLSQNVSHFDGLDIKNTISTRFAFRTDSDEALRIVDDMGLPENEGFEDTLPSLRKGECLMQDFLGRCSTVQISNWKKDWAQAFNSNPLTKVS